ncbi:isocitrate lyase/phosphoenolpyruvate mutase family protein [Nitrosopumilus zosterae]|nr:isocitrate lyase/phosphoenolpyruvate mutase family protein [Nitrosopumilus zosterae]BDQ31791.1 isocitrate lyase/phosphoenolpyruvate mutase family protein [Nitrosopumilus zosterae]
MTNCKILKRMVQSKPIVKIGGAFDALSAKLVETSGFDAIWAGSFAISATHALPDASILTMTDFLRSAENMVDACNIPVIADCDTGFGGPPNVSHAVKKYEKAGIAGISIEDKIFPKQNSLLKNSRHELLPEKDFVAKIIAARESKKEDDFMIIARTEALIAEKGMDEALKRANAYENAGADAILIHSKENTPEEIFEFSKKWNSEIPLVVVPTSYPSVKLEELITHKIKMVIYANQSLRAAHNVMSKVLKDIIQKESIDKINIELSSMEEIFKLQEMYKINDQEKIIESNLKKMGYIN